MIIHYFRWSKDHLDKESIKNWTNCKQYSKYILQLNPDLIIFLCKCIESGSIGNVLKKSAILMQTEQL